ncbi:MAG: hypothetical protein JWM68_2737 [Verrucomicrobiales bacterium]|nr:hypothetical protein [Verrucomicrobiales bacterium]
MKTFASLLICLLLTLPTLASEEQHATWSSVDITSNIQRAGLVKVSGQVDGGCITMLQIVAFGRTNVVSGEDLKKISSYPLADMKITHEPGYELLGGYRVNVRLRRIAYDSNEILQDETAIIAVTETSGLQPVMIQKTR